MSLSFILKFAVLQELVLILQRKMDLPEKIRIHMLKQCRNSENVAVYFHTDIHYGWLKGKGGRGRDTNGLGVYWREGGIERNIGQAHASCRLSRFATNDRFAD